MSPPSELLTSFLPLDLWTRVQRSGGEPARIDFQGTALFVDVAGSTALAEHLLGSRGTEGTEALSRVLNQAFGSLIDTITEFGGEVSSFAGDAVVVIWPDDRRSTAETVHLATACALELPGVLSSAVEVDGHPLELRAGVGSGAMTSCLVGSSADRQLVTFGPALRDAFQATATALRGKVVLADSARSAAGETMAVTDIGGGFFAPTDASGAARPGIESPLLSDDEHSAIGAVVPDFIRSRLEPGLDSWLAELRQVSVVYANIKGLDLSADDAVQRLDKASRTMHDIAEAHGGVVELGVDDKGIVALCVFGLPPVSERRGRDVMRAAVAIRDSLTETGLQPAIGVAAGRVFCGPIGNDRRREYGILGNPVHLAARLARLHSGEVVCDDVAHREAEARFEELEPVSLKGYARPVTPWRFAGFREKPKAPTRPTALGSGRPEQEGSVVDLLQTAAEGSFQPILWEGHAGIGKTTLLTSAARRAEAAGFPYLRGRADRPSRSTAYFAWRQIVSGALGIAANMSRARRTQRALEVLGDDPELTRSAPLLTDVLDVELDESTFTSGMDGASRAEALQELVAALLRRFAAGRPLLLLLDDIQWFDPASWALVLRSLPHAGTVVAVMASRPEREYLPPEAKELVESPDTKRIVLSGLNVETIRQAAEHAIGASPLGEGLSRWLRDTSEGNPFYAREIALALVESGQVVVEGGRVVRSPTEAALDDLGLPATVEGLVVSRIDRIDTSQQILLKTASVLGRRFQLEELRSLLQASSYPEAIRYDLGGLADSQLIMSTKDGAFSFTHQITHDVVYGLMVGEQRTRLHRRFAMWIEEEFRDDLSSEYARLAHHWSRAGDEDNTIKYLELASAESVRKGAYAEAVSFLKDVLDLDERRGRVAPLDRQGRWNRRLGYAYQGLGRTAEASDHTATSLEQLGSSLPRSRIGWALMSLKQAAIQVTHLLLPRSTLPAGSPKAERAQDIVIASSIQSDYKYGINDPIAQIAVILLGANTADRMEPALGVGRPLAGVGALTHMIGLKKLGWRYVERARSISAAARDVSTQVRVEMIASAMHFWSGEPREAKETFLKAESLAEAHGLRRELVEVWGVAVNVEMLLAEYESHARRGRTLLEIPSHRSPTQGEVWGLLVLAQNCLKVGSIDRAEDHIDKLRQYAARLEHQERVAYEAVEVLLQIRREDWPQLRLSATRLSESLGVGSRSGTRIWAHWQSFQALSDARLTLLERAGNHEKRSASDEMKRTYIAHLRFAKTVPVSLPGALLAKGRALCLMGKEDRGRRLLRKASDIAERFRDPYAHARATHYLALAEKPEHASRRETLEAARAAYAAIGCAWEEGQLAQMLSQDDWRRS